MKVDQSEAERRPRAVPALAVGMLSVWVFALEEKPKPPTAEVVAKVWVLPVWPPSEVMPPAEKPRVEVATQVATEPFDWRSIPLVPREFALSRTAFTRRVPVAVKFVEVALPAKKPLPCTTRPLVPTVEDEVVAIPMKPETPGAEIVSLLLSLSKFNSAVFDAEPPT